MSANPKRRTQTLTSACLLTLTHTHTHLHTIAQTLAHIRTHSHTHTRTHSHTPTHTLAHTHADTFSLFFFLPKKIERREKNEQRHFPIFAQSNTPFFLGGQKEFKSFFCPKKLDLNWTRVNFGDKSVAVAAFWLFLNQDRIFSTVRP